MPPASRIEPAATFQFAVTALLMLVGAALRLWQYFANSSVWIDEAALARNIIERPAADLFRPLDYAQVAPVGFLLIEKGITTIAGTSELALRAFPLASGLASLLLFWVVARWILSGWAVPFAVGLFSLGIPFIYFASQVKQYSSDAAAALLLLAAALQIFRRGITQARAWLLGIVGALVVWVSQSALFVLAGIGSGLLVLVLLERDELSARRLSVTGILWVTSAAAAAAYSLSIVGDTDREYFRWFWGAGFMPFPPQSLADIAWLPRRLIWVFGAFAPGLGHTNGGLNYRWSPLFAGVMVYGFWVLWRTQRDAALFLMLPPGFVVVFSAASLYPFTARLLAFIVPYLLVATAAGAGHFISHGSRWVHLARPVVLAVLGGAPLFATAQALPPSWVQHLRPVMEHLRQHRQPNDEVYVYYGANLAFGYYAPRFAIAADGVVRGRCSLADPREYLRELDAFRGEPRVWVIITHLNRDGELDLLRGYLDQIGRQLDAVFMPASSGRPMEHAYGYLYDLSNPERLRLSTADTLPLPGVFEPLQKAFEKWGCYGITGGEPEFKAWSPI